MRIGSCSPPQCVIVASLTGLLVAILTEDWPLCQAFSEFFYFACSSSCHIDKVRVTVVAMEHTEWAATITKGDAVNAIATKSGIVHRTFARQMERGKISAENVIAIATAYGHHPVGALVDTGYLDEKWAQQIDPAHTLRMVTEDQLADEVLRRMKLGQAHGALDEPIDALAARREAKKSNNPAPTVRNRHQDIDMPDDAVADSSPEVGGTLDDYDL